MFILFQLCAVDFIYCSFPRGGLGKGLREERISSSLHDWHGKEQDCDLALFTHRTFCCLLPRSGRCARRGVHGSLTFDLWHVRHTLASGLYTGCSRLEFSSYIVCKVTPSFTQGPVSHRSPTPARFPLPLPCCASLHPLIAPPLCHRRPSI